MAFFSLPLPLRYALRELRGGLSGFRIFMACLVLGVAVIAAVGSVTSAIQDNLYREGQAILGGDLQIRMLQRRLTDTFQADTFLNDWLSENQAIISRHSRLRTMARHEAAEKSGLVELRGIDDQYPLYGDLKFQSDYSKKDLFRAIDQDNGEPLYGALIDPLARDRLGLGIGDRLTLGSLDVEVRGLLITAPDASSLGFGIGPPIMVHSDALQLSGLVTTGSLIDHYYNIKFKGRRPDLKALQTDLEETYDTSGWRFTNRDNAAPGLRRVINRLSDFMIIVGLASLVVGGVGVGNAVKGYMDRKTKTIATLKILGASGRTIFWTYFLQVMMIGLLAVLVGIILGALTPSFVSGMLPDEVPVEISTGFYPLSLLVAGFYGVMIITAFTVWPLGKARDLPAVRLFRDIVSPSRRLIRKGYLAVIALAIMGVCAVSISLSGNQKLAVGFLVMAATVLLLLRGLSWLIEKAASRLPRPKNVLRRLALTNLHRPGAATGAVVVSLGLGLTLFASLSLIQDNLQRQLDQDVPEDTPSFFAIDIQAADFDDFKKLTKNIAGVSGFEAVPNLRGSIVRVKDIPVSDMRATIPENQRWLVSGDRGITYGNDFARDNKLVKGEIWPSDYSGDPEVSVGAEQAEALGLDIGDSITVNVLGVEITAKVRSMRQVVWERGGLNYVFIFDPHTFKAAPHTYIATFKVAGEEARRETFDTITRAYSAVTLIDVKDILNTVRDVVTQASSAIDAIAYVAIVAGILVLAGAIAAGFRQRVYESVILKVVGARRGQILSAYTLEFIAVGVVTAFVALFFGVLASYIVVTFIFDNQFYLSFPPMIVVVVISLGVTLVLGLGSSWRALSVKPNIILHHE